MTITVLTSNEQAINELGARIRATRIDTPLTQEELAVRAGVSLSTVAKLERGEDIRLSSLLNILRALGLLASANSLVPEVAPRPTDFAMLGKPRQRARSSKQRTATPWKWGDEQ